MTDDRPHPDVERFLRDRAGALDQQAAAIDAREVAERTAPHVIEPRTRWGHAPTAFAGRARPRPALVAGMMAALLIGSVVGFIAGRTSAPGRSSVAARGVAQDRTTPTVVQASTVGGAFSAPNGGPQMTRLFVRTTADGITLRGYLQSFDAGGAPERCDAASSGGWCPPPECNPTTTFIGELSNADAVSQGGTPAFPFAGPARSAGSIPFGQMEGAPASVWIIQATDAVASVRGIWPDGFVDEMAPVEGWALVARAGNGLPNSVDAILTDGSVFQIKDPERGGASPTQCMRPPPAPPELPSRGEEQPTDVAAATAAVRTAYTTVYDHSTDPSSRRQYIEDWDNLVPTNDQAKKNFPQAADTITVDVGEVRFLSATDAALYFELKYQGGQLFGQQIGYAKLVDGTWKVARDTMCMVYGWAGAQCDPPPDPNRARSSGSAPQPGTYSGPVPTPTTSTGN